MRKEIPQNSEEFKTFTDFFELYKAIGEPEPTDEYWADVMQRVERFTNIHDTRLGHSMAHALLEALLDTPETSKYCRWLTIIASEAVKDEEIAKCFIAQALNLAKIRRDK